jgi:hypothetical protein
MDNKNKPAKEAPTAMEIFHSNAVDHSKNMSHSRRIDRDRYVTKQKVDEKRPEYAIPAYGRYQGDQQNIIEYCNLAYKQNALVRSVIDLMSEWATDGLKIVADNDKDQAIFDAWSNRIRLMTTAEQFCRWIGKAGNVVVRRRWGTSKRKRIPLSYVFYDPVTIELVGDFLGTIPDKRRYAIKIPIYNVLNRNQRFNDVEQQIFESLPKEIKDAVNNVGKTTGSTYYYPIPENEIYVASYKKDDSEVWAIPFTYTVLPYILYNEKLQRTKMALLDSMMNPLRVFKLGDIVNGAVPSPAAGEALEKIISNSTEGGTDILWDNLIEVEVLYPPIEKMKDLVDSDEKILYGLGIQVFAKEVIKESAPIAIKDLVKRVEYVRNQLLDFVNTEIKYLCDGLGITKYPMVQFRYVDFYTEQTYINFMLELLDRNVISDQKVLEMIKENPAIEKARVNKEQALRDKEELPQKASPYHNPAQLMMDKFKEQELENNYNNESKKKLGSSKPGRPKGANDTVPRQRTQGELTVLASQWFKQVSDLTETKYLSSLGKEDLRNLTNKEKEELFQIKAYAFAAMDPSLEIDEVTEPILEAQIDKADMSKIQNFWTIYEQMVTGAGIKLTQSNKNNALIAAFVKNYEDLQQ